MSPKSRPEFSFFTFVFAYSVKRREGAGGERFSLAMEFNFSMNLWSEFAKRELDRAEQVSSYQ